MFVIQIKHWRKFGKNKQFVGRDNYRVSLSSPNSPSSRSSLSPALREPLRWSLLCLLCLLSLSDSGVEPCCTNYWGKKQRGKHVPLMLYYTWSQVLHAWERKNCIPFLIFCGHCCHVYGNSWTDPSHFHPDHPQHFDASSSVSCCYCHSQIFSYHYKLEFLLYQRFQHQLLPSLCAPCLFHVPSPFRFYA